MIVLMIRGPRTTGMNNEPIDAGKGNTQIEKKLAIRFYTFIILNFEVDIERSSKINPTFRFSKIQFSSMAISP